MLEDLFGNFPPAQKKAMQYDEYSLQASPPYFVAKSMAQIIKDQYFLSNNPTKNPYVVDIMAGIGVTAIAFGKIFSKVIAIEKNIDRHEMLINNIKHSKLTHIEPLIGDFRKMAAIYKVADILFIDPDRIIKEKRPIIIKIKEALAEQKKEPRPEKYLNNMNDYVDAVDILLEVREHPFIAIRVDFDINMINLELLFVDKKISVFDGRDSRLLIITPLLNL